ncbi:MAG: DUF6377 domain-containing protein [Prevotellaceae bacterium]|nr:DUF6377 domain-containing protein [Prevotellaceae bacterium]
MQNLDTLDYYLSIEGSFIKIKEKKIADIKQQVAKNQTDNEKLYSLYNELFEQYKSYSYDSAFFYVKKLIKAAETLNDSCKLFESNTKLCFCYLSSGLFSNAFDVIKKIKKSPCSDPEMKIQFLLVKARLYYDIADFSKDENYKKHGNKILGRALTMMPQNTSQYYSQLGLKAMKSDDYSQAIAAFNALLNSKNCSSHDIAIATSSLAYIYQLQGDYATAKEFLLKAVIADIKSSTKETVALRNLAKQLYQEKDILHAAKYIRKALVDAQTYNARHRLIEISDILSIIEGERINMIEEQKKRVEIFLWIISGVTLLILGAFIVIITLFSKLNKVKKTLQKTNDELTVINEQFIEANKIKEEYIGYFFNLDTEYIAKLYAFQRWMIRKLESHQYSDLQNIPAKLDAKIEREKLYVKFDEIVLRIFPNFVAEFNLLLNEQTQIILKKNELLNTELRIYALMRLGVRNNENIAKFLHCSINTIYSYKAKIKNNALYPPEEFKEKLMAIGGLYSCSLKPL